MPVTTQAANVEVKAYKENIKFVSPKQILEQTWPENADCDKIIASSFNHFEYMRPTRNGFVMCALDAYLQHNHLVLRPEDIWFAILTQFNFYVNKHAEELRSFFVAHKGKKKLQILQDPPLDLEKLVLEFTHLIAENIKDPALREWIMPSFTTTTATDKAVASILMMGTLQKYFAYFGGITCGIPSVTLLGEKQDWEDILKRLDFLATFKYHDEIQLWYALLKPIIASFVRTFDAANSPAVSDFWSKTVHQKIDNYSGSKLITGWILAFCFWSAEGDQLVARWLRYQNIHKQLESADVAHETGIEKLANLVLDMEKYGALDWDSIPAGFAHVPIHIKADGEKYKTTAVAGSVGWTLCDSERVLPKDWKPANPAQEKEKEKGEGSLRSGSTLVGPPSANANSKGMGSKPAASDRPAPVPGPTSNLRRLLRTLFCLSEPKPSTPEPGSFTPLAGNKPTASSSASSEEPNSNTPTNTRSRSLSSSPSTIGSESSYARKADTLQPVSGWWIFRSKTGVYGKDPDVPDVQFDSETEDYDRDLAENGRPL